MDRYQTSPDENEEVVLVGLQNTPKAFEITVPHALVEEKVDPHRFSFPSSINLNNDAIIEKFTFVYLFYEKKQ